MLVLVVGVVFYMSVEQEPAERHLGVIGGFFATAGRLIHPERLLTREKSRLEGALRRDEPAQTEDVASE